MKKTYLIEFTGRKKGAVGIFYRIVAERKAESPEQAILAVYDEFDHIHNPIIRIKP